MLKDKTNPNNVLIVDKNKDIKSVTPEVANKLVADGSDWKAMTQSDLMFAKAEAEEKELYEGPIGTTVAALGGAARGLTLGLSDVLFTMDLMPGPEEWSITSKETINELKEANPIASGAGEVAGMIAPALLTAGGSLVETGVAQGAKQVAQKGLGKEILEFAGKKGMANLIPTQAASTIGQGVAATVAKLGGKSVLAKVISKGAGGAAETGLMSAGFEASRQYLDDEPDFNSEAFLSNVAWSSLFGGVITGGLSSGSLAKQTGNWLNDTSVIKAIKKTTDPISKALSINKGFKWGIDKLYAPIAKLRGTSGMTKEEVRSTVSPMDDLWAASKLELAESPGSVDVFVKDADDAIKNMLEFSDVELGVMKATRKSKAIVRAVNKITPKQEKELIETFGNNIDNQLKNIDNVIDDVADFTKHTDKAYIKDTGLLQDFQQYGKTLKDLKDNFGIKIKDVVKIDPKKLSNFIKAPESFENKALREIFDNHYKSLVNVVNGSQDTGANLLLDQIFKSGSKELIESTMANYNITNIFTKIANIRNLKTTAKSYGPLEAAGAVLPFAGFGMGFGPIAPALALAKVAKAGKNVPEDIINLARLEQGASFIRDTIKSSAKKFISPITKLPKDDLAKITRAAIASSDKDKVLPSLNELEKFKQDPNGAKQNIINSLHQLPGLNNTQKQVAAKAGKLYDTVMSKLPNTKKVDPTFGIVKEHLPREMERLKFEQEMQGAVDPAKVIKDFGEGKVNMKGIRLMKEVYPDIYNSFKTQVMEAALAPGVVLSYSQRMKIKRAFGVKSTDLPAYQSVWQKESEGKEEKGKGKPGRPRKPSEGQSKRAVESQQSANQRINSR